MELKCRKCGFITESNSYCACPRCGMMMNKRWTPFKMGATKVGFSEEQAEFLQNNFESKFGLF